MTWQFGPVILPIDPASIQRRVARKQVVDKLQQQLPFAVDTGPDMYELNITGLIWPEYKAWQLWEIVKAAELPVIEIITDDFHFDMYNGRYAINRADTGMSGPRFIADPASPDGVSTVHDYNVTFVQFADQGLLANGNSQDLELDEDGIGFGDININMGDFNFGDFTFPFDFGSIFGI